jgi:hypothetical protein
MYETERMNPVALSLAAMLLVAGLATTTWSSLPAAAGRRAPTTSEVLGGGARSENELVTALLTALEAGDRNALQRLRVTEAEYRNVILPGSVSDGEPLRRYPDEVADFAWGNLHTKSFYWEQKLLAEFGRRHYRLKSKEWADGVVRYAGYMGHRQLRLVLEDTASSTEVRLATGSVAEVDGRFKFISFIKD